MRRTGYTCDWCGTVWGNPHSANACCDDTSMTTD